MLLLLLIITLLYVAFLLYEYSQHVNKLRNIQYRIHVNGIRGKSSVTRLLTAALQGGDIRTVGKATGSAAKLLSYDGSESEVKRKGPANVYENVKIFRHYVDQTVDAVVFECMAVNPKYQKFLEQRVMHSNIGIITNVREDHMEVLGYTLEEIAKNLASTIPYNGFLVTSEDNPKLREYLAKIAKTRNTKLINALKYSVEDRYIREFPYYEYKENIAIALAIADIIGISRGVVLDSLKNSKPDVGVTVIERLSAQGKEIVWCNLFAVNDRESVVKNVIDIGKQYAEKDQAIVCILNQRGDRPDRANQFLDIATNDLTFDLIVTAGAYEEQAKHYLEKKGQKYLAINKFVDTPGEELIEMIFKATGKKKIMLFGLENIHTVQAEEIMHYFGHLRGE